MKCICGEETTPDNSVYDEESGREFCGQCYNEALRLIARKNTFCVPVGPLAGKILPGKFPGTLPR